MKDEYGEYFCCPMCGEKFSEEALLSFAINKKKDELIEKLMDKLKKIEKEIDDVEK